MAVDTVKLALYNTLAETETWDVDPGGVTKPPVIGLLIPGKNYTNIVGSAALSPLVRDGDQNLPIFFISSPGNIRMDFGVAYTPQLIAFLNHNCFETGDRIEVRRGLNGVNLVYSIVAPNRSVDLFYPLRFNDAWYNSGSVTFDYQKNSAITELQSGSLFDYETEPPFVNIGLDWGRKAEGATDKFLEHQVNTVCAAASHSPYKQVLVLYEDRVCVFGRLKSNGSYQELSDGSFSPSHRFRAEYPRKFWRSFLVE
jgi:hypothetical protein